MALPVIAILALGGLAVVAMSGKKGGKGFRALNGQCLIIVRDIETEEEFAALLQRIQKVVYRAYENVTGESATPFESYADPDQGARAYYKTILGDAPGDIDRNMDLAHAVATEAMKLTADPDCLVRLGVAADLGADVNGWGPDWFVWQPGMGGNLNQGDVAEYMTELFNSVVTDLSRFGYDVGFGYTLAPGARLPSAAEAIAQRFVA